MKKIQWKQWTVQGPSPATTILLTTVAATIVPMALLLTVSYAFFVNAPTQTLPFEYWTFLVVAWVLGTALIIARMLASNLLHRLDGVANALNVTDQEADENVPHKSDSGGDLAALAGRFERIESELAEGRRMALARIRELEQTNARLEQSADQQSALFSAIAHEIRTPLSAIVSSARIIQRYRERKPEVIEQFTGTIVSEGTRLARLVADMSDLVKVESCRLEWQDGEIRPGRLVGAAIDHVQDLVRSHEVTLRVNTSKRLPCVWGDSERLAQALESLIRHAIKSSPQGAQIDVSVCEEDGKVRFSVADGGNGQTSVDLASVFEQAGKFSSSELAGARAAGIGLGVLLCREVVARHGGRVTVAPTPRGGSEFSFTVPCVPVYRNAMGQVESARRLRVALLMKNPVLADCGIRALRLEEIEGRASSNMPGFFGLIADWPPDVVVMDTVFAGQLSDEAEKRIREAGVSHLLARCPNGELREISPATHSEPLLSLLTERLAPGSQILVVEDDEDYGGVIEFELAQSGYSVIKATNGVDALELVTSRSPDAMILDVALPHLDGVGVLEHLDRRGLAIPTVVLTSLDDPATEDRLRDLGVIGIVRKYELIREDGDDAATWVSRVLAPVLSVPKGDIETTEEAGAPA